MGQKEESGLVARYLLGVTPSVTSKQLYQNTITTHDYLLSEDDARMWNIAMKYPWLLPYIDAGLALTNKLSPLRKRIHLMFAILETETRLSEKFIYTEKPFWFLRSAFYVIRAIFRAIVGSLLVRMLYHL